MKIRSTKRKLFPTRTRKLGLPPGSPVYVGKPDAVKPRVSLIDYNEQRITERPISNPEECLPFRQADSVTWVNVDGLGDSALLEHLAKIMGFHALTLEDILNTDQRPKAENYGDYFYVVAKMLEVDRASNHIKVDQLSLVLGNNFVLSIQEEAGDPFEPVRNRIRTSVGRIRKAGADYLAYALLDLVVDQYFEVLEWLGERLEEMDEMIVNGDRPDLMQQLHGLKRETIFLRKSVLPLREVVAEVRNSDSDLIKDSTMPYLRDLYDHIVQVGDRIDTCRDLLASLHDIHFTILSNRTNSVMKIIAVLSSIFLPLTFITGVFGMNFDFMPLLHQHWGFWVSVGAMLTTVISMLWYFRHQRWI